MSPLVLVAWLAVSGDLPPKDAEVELPIKCGNGLCIMPAQIVKDMVEAHNLHVDEIRRLEKQLADTRAMKGCAKLEVLPKLKKERDT